MNVHVYSFNIMCQLPQSPQASVRLMTSNPVSLAYCDYFIIMVYVLCSLLGKMC